MEAIAAVKLEDEGKYGTKAEAIVKTLLHIRKQVSRFFVAVADVARCAERILERNASSSRSFRGSLTRVLQRFSLLLCSMLEIVAAAMKANKLPLMRLEGNVRSRSEAIAKFNASSDECSLLMCAALL